MITKGKRISGNPVLIEKETNKTLKPQRIPLNEKSFNEGWIQELIQKNPNILPVAEIEPAFTPLISIGKEVPTADGSIDNLFISPNGNLTIVETKLWRNPEARRQVVGQIIDYAKEITRWTYEDLDNRVRTYNKKYRKEDSNIIDTIKMFENIDDDDENKIVDKISRKMKRGEFLLLIVGDGIRESVEAMAEFINQTPQLHFTLALVELQTYAIEICNSIFDLVIPQVITRTREITRAVVRIEGDGNLIKLVQLGIDTKPQSEKQPLKRQSLSEEDYFDALGQSVDSNQVDFARKLIEDMENRGCVIEWKNASYVIKLPDPGGSGQNLTLLVVQKNGNTYPGWLGGQLRSLSLPEQIDYDFVKKSAALFKKCGVNPNYPDQWSRTVSLRELQEQYEDFTPLVQNVIDRIKEDSQHQI
jgi:hypothetical protein